MNKQQQALFNSLTGKPKTTLGTKLFLGFFTLIALSVVIVSVMDALNSRNIKTLKDADKKNSDKLEVVMDINDLAIYINKNYSKQNIDLLVDALEKESNLK